MLRTTVVAFQARARINTPLEILDVSRFTKESLGRKHPFKVRLQLLQAQDLWISNPQSLGLRRSDMNSEKAILGDAVCICIRVKVRISFFTTCFFFVYFLNDIYGVLLS